jgi:hypothetical protein
MLKFRIGNNFLPKPGGRGATRHPGLAVIFVRGDTGNAEPSLTVLTFRGLIARVNAQETLPIYAT